MARRYGTTPGALVGLEARADAAARARDWEASDRWRREALRFSEACALVALHEEMPGSGEVARPEPPKPATLGRGGIKGVAPYRPDECPPWLDQLLGEGVAGMQVAGEALVA